MTDITWDDQAVAEYTALAELAALYHFAPQVEALAHALAPVRTIHVPVPKFVHRRPGTHKGHGGKLKASVHWEIQYDHEGPAAYIIALWYGRFMDPKARQLHYKRPFLPTALYTVCDGRVIYLN